MNNQQTDNDTASQIHAKLLSVYPDSGLEEKIGTEFTGELTQLQSMVLAIKETCLKSTVYPVIQALTVENNCVVVNGEKVNISHIQQRIRVGQQVLLIHGQAYEAILRLINSQMTPPPLQNHPITQLQQQYVPPVLSAPVQYHQPANYGQSNQMTYIQMPSTPNNTVVYQTNNTATDIICLLLCILFPPFCPCIICYFCCLRD